MGRERAMHGLMAEFDSPERLLDACRSARDAGFVSMDAYAPTEVHGLSEALGMKPSPLPKLVLIGGIVGGLIGYLLQFWTATIEYPMNIGGRPNHSWPSFIVVTFEMTILCAGLTAVVGLIMLCKLPKPYHPVFNVPEFQERASRDRFFLCIEQSDPKFDTGATRTFLEGLDPLGVYEVEL